MRERHNVIRVTSCGDRIVLIIARSGKHRLMLDCSGLYGLLVRDVGRVFLNRQGFRSRGALLRGTLSRLRVGKVSLGFRSQSSRTSPKPKHGQQDDRETDDNPHETAFQLG